MGRGPGRPCGGSFRDGAIGTRHPGSAAHSGAGVGDSRPPAHPAPARSPEIGSSHRWPRPLHRWPPPRSAPAGKHHTGNVNTGSCTSWGTWVMLRGRGTHRGASSCGRTTHASPRKGLSGSGGDAVAAGGAWGAAGRATVGLGRWCCPAHSLQLPRVLPGCPQDAMGVPLGGGRVVWVAGGDMGWTTTPPSSPFRWGGPWAGEAGRGIWRWRHRDTRVVHASTRRLGLGVQFPVQPLLLVPRTRAGGGPMPLTPQAA